MTKVIPPINLHYTPRDYTDPNSRGEIWAVWGYGTEALYETAKYPSTAALGAIAKELWTKGEADKVFATEKDVMLCLSGVHAGFMTEGKNLSGDEYPAKGGRRPSDFGATNTAQQTQKGWRR